jgi:23S rRNA (cytosine1962-C5)-methyltransferase
MDPNSDSSPLDSVPSVALKQKRALPFFNQHPWVFTGAVLSVKGDPAPGDEVVVRADHGNFVARGLFNSNSNIRVRLYSWDENVALDRAFWDERIKTAVALRSDFIQNESTTAFRLINSEADGLSGLTVDRYDDWLLVQLTSLALAERKEILFDLLEEHCSPKGIWLRTEKGIRDLEGLAISDGLVRGEEPPRPLSITENGLTFLVDVAEGQKTGYFLDQRDNRRAVARYTAGHKVLDLFSYSGSFGITAAATGGAESVTCVDSSKPALASAEQNAAANGVAEKVNVAASDCFKYLEAAREEGAVFDTVILDPPKMTRSASGAKSALRGYHSLNDLAVSVLRPGGILVTCCCSGHISRDEFVRMLSGVATGSGRRIQIIESRGHAADHPVSPNCPENAYLKCLICRVV